MQYRPNGIRELQDHEDQRSAVRFPLSLDANAIIDNRSASIRILDISREGCLFTSDAPLDFGQQFTLSVGAAEYERLASVVWVGDELHGCHFSQPLTQADLSGLRLRGAPTSVTEQEQGRRTAFGIDLAAVRKRAGISSTQMAEELGVSRPTLWAWEIGKTLPSRENKARLAKWVRKIELEGGEITSPGLSPTSQSSVIKTVVEAHREAIAAELSIRPERIKVTIEF